MIFTGRTFPQSFVWMVSVMQFIEIAVVFERGSWRLRRLVLWPAWHVKMVSKAMHKSYV